MVRELHRSSFGDGSRISIARNSAHSVVSVFDGHFRHDAKIPMTPAEMRALASELLNEADMVAGWGDAS